MRKQRKEQQKNKTSEVKQFTFATTTINTTPINYLEAMGFIERSQIKALIDWFESNRNHPKFDFYQLINYRNETWQLEEYFVHCFRSSIDNSNASIRKIKSIFEALAVSAKSEPIPLKQKKADPPPKIDLSPNALFFRYAVQGDLLNMQKIRKKVLDVDAKTMGDTPLIVATSANHAHVVQYLLEQKARPDITNNKGFTSMYCALHNKNPSIVKSLLAAGASQEVKGYNILVHAINFHDLATVKLLLEKKVNPNRLAFSLAIEENFHEAIELLVQVPGIRLQEPIDESCNALQLAVHLGHDAIVKLLYSRTDPTRLTQTGHSLWDLALPRPRMFELLIELNLDLNIVNGRKFWLLLTLCFQKNISLTQQILTQPTARFDAEQIVTTIATGIAWGNRERILTLLVKKFRDQFDLRHQYCLTRLALEHSARKIAFLLNPGIDGLQLGLGETRFIAICESLQSAEALIAAGMLGNKLRNITTSVFDAKVLFKIQIESKQDDHSGTSSWAMSDVIYTTIIEPLASVVELLPLCNTALLRIYQSLCERFEPQQCAVVKPTTAIVSSYRFFQEQGFSKKEIKALLPVKPAASDSSRHRFLINQRPSIGYLATASWFDDRISVTDSIVQKIEGISSDIYLLLPPDLSSNPEAKAVLQKKNRFCFNDKNGLKLIQSDYSTTVTMKINGSVINLGRVRLRYEITAPHTDTRIFCCQIENLVIAVYLSKKGLHVSKPTFPQKVDLGEISSSESTLEIGLT